MKRDHDEGEENNDERLLRCGMGRDNTENRERRKGKKRIRKTLEDGVTKRAKEETNKENIPVLLFQYIMCRSILGHPHAMFWVQNCVFSFLHIRSHINYNYCQTTG